VSRAEKKAQKAEKKAAKRGRRGGLIFGAVAGAVAGLLLAPKSGKETRGRLFGEGGFGSQIDRLKGAVGAGKESAADQSEALKHKIEETRERLRMQMDEAGDAVTDAAATDAAAEAPGDARQE
jgi:gas vesicle protein